MHSSVVFAHSRHVKPLWLFIPITFHLLRLELLTVHTRSCFICLISWDPLVCLLSTWTWPFHELRETVVGVHLLESSCFYLYGIFGTHSCQSIFTTMWVFKSVSRCLWVFPFCFSFLNIILRLCNMLYCFVSFATWSWIHDPPISASWVLVSQVYITRFPGSLCSCLLYESLNFIITKIVTTGCMIWYIVFLFWVYLKSSS